MAAQFVGNLVRRLRKSSLVMAKQSVNVLVL
jgi:hypothetical protein